jgi:hypothetical protein
MPSVVFPSAGTRTGLVVKIAGGTFAAAAGATTATVPSASAAARLAVSGRCARTRSIRFQHNIPLRYRTRANLVDRRDGAQRLSSATAGAVIGVTSRRSRAWTSLDVISLGRPPLYGSTSAVQMLSGSPLSRPIA